MNDAYGVQRTAEFVKKEIGKSLDSLISQPLGKDAIESTKRAILNMNGTPIAQAVDFKVISCEYVPETSVFAVNINVATYSPMQYISFNNVIVDTFKYKWDDKLFEHTFFKQAISSQLEKVGPNEITKAKILIRRNMPKDFEQTPEDWCKTLEIFHTKGLDRLALFLIDPSETVRESTKIRIRQLESNKNST